MRLTTQTDYALRMLMYLARFPERLVTINEVAERYEISKNHLMKVAQALSRAGMVQGSRGRSGGLSLAMPTEDISVGRVVRLLEEPSPLVECFPNGTGGCILTEACKLKHALAKAQENFFLTLDTYTLESLVKNNAELSGILGQ